MSVLFVILILSKTYVLESVHRRAALLFNLLLNSFCYSFFVKSPFCGTPYLMSFWRLKSHPYSIQLSVVFFSALLLCMFACPFVQPSFLIKSQTCTQITEFRCCTTCHACPEHPPISTKIKTQLIIMQKLSRIN